MWLFIYKMQIAMNWALAISPILPFEARSERGKATTKGEALTVKLRIPGAHCKCIASASPITRTPTTMR